MHVTLLSFSKVLFEMVVVSLQCEDSFSLNSVNPARIMLHVFNKAQTKQSGFHTKLFKVHLQQFLSDFV